MELRHRKCSWIQLPIDQRGCPENLTKCIISGATFHVTRPIYSYNDSENCIPNEQINKIKSVYLDKFGYKWHKILASATTDNESEERGGEKNDWIMQYAHLLF